MDELFPREVTHNVPRITLTGREKLLVEQHRGLLACEPDEISFSTAAGRLVIVGEGLHFVRYTANEALIGGWIDGMNLQGEGGRS